MTEKIIAWSDLHAHTWQAGERPDRWKDFADAVDRVYEYAQQVNAAMTVFNGDLFESKVSHSSLVWSHIMEAIQRGIKKNPQAVHVFNTGNHDLYRGHSVLRALGSMAQIIDGECGHGFFSFRVGKRIIRTFVLPFGSGVQSFDKDTDYVFTHAEIKGLKHGHGMQSTYTNIDPSWFKHATHVINGHIHIQQDMRVGNCRVHTVGPTIPTNWTDLDDEGQFTRGVLEIALHEDRRMDTLTRIPFEWAPRFLHAGDARARTHDFVRASVADDVDQEEETASVATRERKRLATLRGADMLNEYVERAGTTCDKDMLLKYGRQLYKGE